MAKDKFLIIDEYCRQKIIEELEIIKTEINACKIHEKGETPFCINYGIKLSAEIVKKHISELKGE